MGFMQKILGGSGNSTEDYVELDLGDFDTNAGDARTTVHIAEIDNQEDVIAIKDAVYDGDIVVADITRLRTEDSMTEHFTEELRQVAREVDGDIIQKGDDQLIISPSGVAISRQKLNR
ncbi:cell division protein SepF [Halarchaeum salinum]